MKASVTLFRSDGKTKRGFPVKLTISHLRRTRRRTIGYSSEKYWDDLKNSPLPGHPDFENLFGVIRDIEKKAVQSRFLMMEDLDVAFAYLLDEKKRSILLKDYFEIDIARQRAVGRDGNADSYRDVSSQFEQYAPGLRVEDLTPKVLEGFKRWKLDHGVSHSTMKIYLAVLRALYNKAVRDPEVMIEDKKPFERIMSGLQTKVRRRANRYLTRKQLRKMAYPKPERWKLITGAEKRAVKLSLLQFYLGGANLKDVYFLKEDKFYKDRVMMTRSKTKRFIEEFDLKVFPEARALLDEMMDPVDGYIFPWRKTHVGYRTFLRNHYDDLIEAQKKLKVKVKPIDQRINSGVFRHTFATLAKFEGIDPDIIRELMGHERSDIDTAYKDRFPEKIRDKAHRKIIRLKKKNKK